ncbi:phage tail tape measure protein [Nitratidesulfovibrio termitidis]|uniref:phage tail tape measure protein n=1 Tax=Nitratidesulfovibrio termitidis TaxID=42252 RepID=UPI00040DAF5A|nr:phage tail tape measure protein [Nitratidesulfovibrio termitidis]
MEVFSVFATMSLQDMISGPLGLITTRMKQLAQAADGLGGRMGKLAISMAPVAVAAAVLLGTLGLAAREAIAFESSMADVAKVVNFESAGELQSMSDTILDMSTRIPMAADGLAAIVAAAAQSGVAKADLTEFAEQAAKMGVAFDLTGDQAGKMMADWRAGMNLSLPRVYALADSVNHLSNNMNATAPALGEVIQRVGAVGMASGLAETQVAALGAAFLSAGASPEIASTALKKFTSTLVKGTALSKDAQAAFGSLGFSVTQMARDMQTDAQGTIFKVLQALADKPRELQMSLLTEMFGEEALGAIAPLLANMGNLTQAFELVGDASAYAGSMQAEFDTRSKTTANTLILLGNKMKALMIVAGSYFLPVIGRVAEGVGGFVDMLRGAAQTVAGEFALKLLAGIATAVVAATALSGAIWLLSAAGPMLAKALGPLKAALLGLSWPMWALIAVGAALYVAYRTNFGGMADTIDSWWSRISLVFRGVAAVFATLTDGVGEIRGQLATDIRAAGLEGLVTAVARVVFRIREFLTGMVDTVAPVGQRMADILGPSFSAIAATLGQVFDALGRMTAALFGAGAATDASGWQRFGEVLGTFVAGAAEGVAIAVRALIAPIEMAAGVVQFFLALINGVSLFDAGAALLGTFADGIKSMLAVPMEAVRGAMDLIAKLLPHSDADAGPLSTLTASGRATLTTMGEGMQAAAPDLNAALDDALGAAVPPGTLEAMAEVGVTPAKGREGRTGGRGVTIHIGSVSLPGVSDAQGFVSELQALVAEYDGVPEGGAA